MQFYSSIFRRCWEVTRRNVVLWVFGFFVLFWGGKGIDFELFFTTARLLGDRTSPFRADFWQVDRWEQVFSISSGDPAVWMMSGLLIVAFGFFVLLLIMVSQIGLVDAFARAGKKNAALKRYSLDQALKASERHLAPVFGINIVGKVIIYGLVALAGSPLLLARLGTSQLLYTLLLYFFLTPLAILVSILVKYAVVSTVLEKRGFVSAIRRAGEIFLGNVGVSLELALLMLAVFVGVNILAVAVAAVVTMPFFFFGLMIAGALQTFFGVYLYMLFFYVVGVVAVIFTAALFSAWHFGNWTLLFMELTKGSRRSKIHRLFKGE